MIRSFALINLFCEPNMSGGRQMSIDEHCHEQTSQKKTHRNIRGIFS